MRDPRLVVSQWQGADILVLMPPRTAFSVWWFFEGGTFTGWYVNLESPYVRREAAVETTDSVLDIVVQPDRTWRWKDAGEFAALTGHPAYFDATAAAAIRAEGERVVELIESGDFPFDGTHTDFRPAPDRREPLRLVP